MPVYDRRYRPWSGERRPPSAAVAVIARYGLSDLFGSRLLLVLFVACCLPVLVFASLIYVAHNLDAIAVFEVRDPGKLRAAVAESLFFWFVFVQGNLAFVLTSFAAPTLVAPDAATGGLGLYFSRPIERRDYVLGKLAVLLLPLSASTWVAGLLLVGLQASLEEGWLSAHWRVPLGLVAGSTIWIAFLAVVGLAISAWVRWRPLATGALFGLFLLGSAFATAINEATQTSWGALLAPIEQVQVIWLDLLGTEAIFFRGSLSHDLPVGWCWVGLSAQAAVALWLLGRKLSAVEVVR